MTGYDNADLGLIERIEAAWERFQVDISDKAGAEALEALYWDLVELHRENDEAALDTVFVLAERNPQALAMLSFRALDGV